MQLIFLNHCRREICSLDVYHAVLQKTVENINIHGFNIMSMMLDNKSHVSSKIAVKRAPGVLKKCKIPHTPDAHRRHAQNALRVRLGSLGVRPVRDAVRR